MRERIVISYVEIPLELPFCCRYLDNNEFRTLAAVVYGRPPDYLDMASLRECLASGDIILRSAISLRSLMYCRMALEGTLVLW